MIDIKRQELVDHCNEYLKKDRVFLSKLFLAYVAVDEPSLLQSDAITFIRNNGTKISLMSAINTLHQSGERIVPVVKNGVISYFQ